jgi:hypothetical protein
MARIISAIRNGPIILAGSTASDLLEDHVMKASLQMLAKRLNGLLSVLLAGLAGGCDTIQDHSLTDALWSDSRDTSHCRPQADPKLKLAVCQSVDAGVEGTNPIGPGRGAWWRGQGRLAGTSQGGVPAGRGIREQEWQNISSNCQKMQSHCCFNMNNQDNHSWITLTAAGMDWAMKSEMTEVCFRP